jgi:hypothetical protein
MRAMKIGVSRKLRSIDPTGENEKSKKFNDKLIDEFMAEVATKIPELNSPHHLDAVRQAARAHIFDVRMEKDIGPQLKKEPYLQTYQDYHTRLDELFMPYHAKIKPIPKREASEPSFKPNKQEPFIRYAKLDAEIATAISELEAKFHAAVDTKTITLSDSEIKGALLKVKTHTYWYLKGFKEINLDKSLFTTPNLKNSYDYINQLSLPIMEKLERMAKTDALTSCVANGQGRSTESKTTSLGKQAGSPAGSSVFSDTCAGSSIKDRITALQLEEGTAAGGEACNSKVAAYG